VNDSGLFLATVKCHEALSKLAAAAQAVETLTLIECCEKARQELSGTLSSIEAQMNTLEGYTSRLRERS
jgi:hypothetical protein